MKRAGRVARREDAEHLGRVRRARQIARPYRSISGAQVGLDQLQGPLDLSPDPLQPLHPPLRLLDVAGKRLLQPLGELSDAGAAGPQREDVLDLAERQPELTKVA